MRWLRATTLVAVAAIAIMAMGSVRAASTDEIRATFRKFVAAQNAHDLKRLDGLLNDSPNFLWIDSDSVLRTRDGALRRMGELFRRSWRVDPDWSTFQIVMLDVSTAEVFVSVSITDGALARSTWMNQVLVKTSRGWRVLTVLTVKVP